MICQVPGSFTSGADAGIAGAVVVGDHYYEEMISRISQALDRVLKNNEDKPWMPLLPATPRPRHNW